MFGFLKKKKEQDKLFTEFQKLIESDIDDELNYINMTSKELSKLSDEELYCAVEDRINNKVEEYDEILDGINALSEVEKHCYVCQYFNMEVENGGLCQFFVNSSRDVAPFLSESLEAVGAPKHKKLFEDFIRENEIDINDLNSFIIYKEKDYEKQLKRYPYDDFDDKFYNLKSLEDIITKYIQSISLIGFF